MANLTSIVKVQRPLVADDNIPMVLIYNAGKDKQTQQPVTAEVLKAMGDETKMFFRATWHPAYLRWDIGEPTKWQDW